jgi:serine/threonine protein kinase
MGEPSPEPDDLLRAARGQDASALGRLLELGRRVDLKVLPFASTLDAKQLQRFKNEAQAAAHLHHQNIVPVHATGCERGVHYYAMQLIDGHTLAEVIADLRRPNLPVDINLGNDVHPAAGLCDVNVGQAFGLQFGTFARRQPRVTATS